MFRYTIILKIILVLSAACLMTRCGNNYNTHIDTVAVNIHKAAGKIQTTHPYYQNKVIHKTATFYEANQNTKHWLDKKDPFPKFKAFVQEVKESYRYGMNPDDYEITKIETAVEALYKNRKRTDAEMSELDVRITASFFLFTTHLLEGRIRHPGAKDYIWKRGAPHEDDVALLIKNDTKKELRKELDELQPEDRRYRKLQQALNEYRDLEARHSFKSIPKNIHLKPGDINASVALVKRRLMLTDLKVNKLDDDSAVYDTALLHAVKTFQKRYGLEEDGIVDSELAGYMNMPLSNLADIIALNLERLRWQPHIPSDDEYIVVNVPEYMLRIYKDEKETFQTRVVLGSEFNATPIFADTLKYVVFSPTWNVPQSILEEEFLPRLKSDPSHYSKDFTFYKNGKEIDPQEEDWENEKIDLASYQAVQKPGTTNSLGHVKFVLPNNYKIYLHDTPADRLFNQQDRAFSHGCVRLEKPLELAEYLLRYQKDWDRKKIVAAMQLEEPKQVNLKKNYPIHIVYHTAWVDDEGLINFRKDVYGHDERQLAQLNRNRTLLGYSSHN
jgi:L,D-transpeptidase YcbB